MINIKFKDICIDVFDRGEGDYIFVVKEDIINLWFKLR